MLAPTHAQVVQVWERQRGETPRQYELFSQYRKLPAVRRFASTLARKLGMSIRRMEQIAHDHHWKRRAEEWDRFIELQRLQGERLARIEMSKRQALLGMRMQKKAKQGLRRIDPGSLDAHAISNLAMTGVKIERLARGASTENEAHQSQQEIRVVWGGTRPPWAPKDSAIVEAEPRS